MRPCRKTETKRYLEFFLTSVFGSSRLVTAQLCSWMLGDWGFPTFDASGVKVSDAGFTGLLLGNLIQVILLGKPQYFITYTHIWELVLSSLTATQFRRSPCQVGRLEVGGLP